MMSHERKVRVLTPSEQERVRRAEKVKTSLWENYINESTVRDDAARPDASRRFLHHVMAMRIVERAITGQLQQEGLRRTSHEIRSISNGRKFRVNKVLRERARFERRLAGIANS